MKEKMLVLGIAEPYKSRKYEVAICVAGITSRGQFRRVYSVPIKHYVARPFMKFQYIQYEIVGKGDGRPESRKVDHRSIEPLEFASLSTVSEKIRNNTSPSLDYLRQRSKISLGIVKPYQIIDCRAERQCKRKTGRYTRLRGNASNPICLLPFWIKLEFLCRPSCNTHYIMWEDIEIGNYYRKLLLTYDSQTAMEKTEERAATFLKKFNPYFLMGTHVWYRNVWLIISVINQLAEHFHPFLHF
jgi:hypothetical protein